MANPQRTPEDALPELTNHGAAFVQGLVSNIGVIRDHYASVDNRLGQILQRLNAPQDIVRTTLDDNVQNNLRTLDDRLSRVETAVTGSGAGDRQTQVAAASAQPSSNDLVTAVNGLQELSQQVASHAEQPVQPHPNAAAEEVLTPTTAAKGERPQPLAAHHHDVGEASIQADNVLAMRHDSEDRARSSMSAVKQSAGSRPSGRGEPFSGTGPADWLKRPSRDEIPAGHDRARRMDELLTAGRAPETSSRTHASPDVEHSTLPSATAASDSKSAGRESSQVKRKAASKTPLQLPTDEPPDVQILNGTAGSNPALPVTKIPGKRYRDLAVAEADYTQNFMSNDDIEYLRKELKSTAPGKWYITLDSAPKTLGADIAPEHQIAGEVADRDGVEGPSGSNAPRRSRRQASVPAAIATLPAKPLKKRARQSLDAVPEEHSEEVENRLRPHKKLRTLPGSRVSVTGSRAHSMTSDTSVGTPVAQSKSHKQSIQKGVARSDIWQSAAAGTNGETTKRHSLQDDVVNGSSVKKRIEYDHSGFLQELSWVSPQTRQAIEQQEAVLSANRAAFRRPASTPDNNASSAASDDNASSECDGPK